MNTLLTTLITTTILLQHGQDPICVKDNITTERPDTIGANINDYKYIDQQARNLRTMIQTGNKIAYEYALTCRDNRIRAAASLVAADHGKEYIPDLIKNIIDQDVATQQAARQSLVRLARAADNIKIPTRYMSGTREHIDFGPMAGDNGTQASTSQALWELWFRSLTPEQLQNIEKTKTTQVNINGNRGTVKTTNKTTDAGGPEDKFQEVKGGPPGAIKEK